MNTRLLTAAGAAMLAPQALATPIELTARGSSLSGAMFELVMTYESLTMGIDPDPDGSNQYSAVLSARVWIDGDLQFDVADPSDLGIFQNILIANNNPFGGPDGPLVDLFASILAESSTNNLLTLTLRDYDTTAFDDFALPTSLDLMDFEDRLFTFNQFGDPPTEYTIEFLETRVVPAPGGAACGLGLLLLSTRRRR